MSNVPFDLGRLPALRHLKVQQLSYGDNLALLHSVTQLLSLSSSLSSSFNGIEVLEIGFTWRRIEVEHGKDLFFSDAGWPTLDQLLTSQMFVSLRRIILRLDIEFSKRRSQRKRNDSRQHILELERNLAFYVNDLFPLFRADTQRTLESQITCRYSDY